MPAERIAMRQVRDVLRLNAAGVSGNEIARRVGVASSTVRLTLKRLAIAGLSWPLSAELTDAALEAQLFTEAGKKQGHRRLGLTGMAQAFAELEASGEGATLTHADWLGLLVDREMTHRRDKRLAARLRYAKLRHQAVVEDIDYRAPRGLDRGLFNKLADGEWIDAHDNLILCGPTGLVT